MVPVMSKSGYFLIAMYGNLVRMPMQARSRYYRSENCIRVPTSVSNDSQTGKPLNYTGSYLADQERVQLRRLLYRNR